MIVEDLKMVRPKMMDLKYYIFCFKIHSIIRSNNVSMKWYGKFNLIALHKVNHMKTYTIFNGNGIFIKMYPIN